MGQADQLRKFDAGGVKFTYTLFFMAQKIDINAWL